MIRVNAIIRNSKCDFSFLMKLNESLQRSCFFSFELVLLSSVVFLDEKVHVRWKSRGNELKES
jgi:hypothetical protein